MIVLRQLYLKNKQMTGYYDLMLKDIYKQVIGNRGMRLSF